MMLAYLAQEGTSPSSPGAGHVVWLLRAGIVRSQRRMWRARPDSGPSASREKPGTGYARRGRHRQVRSAGLPLPWWRRLPDREGSGRGGRGRTRVRWSPPAVRSHSPSQDVPTWRSAPSCSSAHAPSNGTSERLCQAPRQLATSPSTSSGASRAVRRVSERQYVTVRSLSTRSAAVTATWPGAVRRSRRRGLSRCRRAVGGHCRVAARRTAGSAGGSPWRSRPGARVRTRRPRGGGYIDQLLDALDGRFAGQLSDSPARTWLPLSAATIAAAGSAG